MPSNIVRLNYRAATYACLVAGMTTSRAVLRSGDTEARADHLAVEAPLVLALGDQVLAVLMRTPGHDLELAAGWLRVESGVETTDELVTLRQCREEDTDRVHITLRPGVRPPRPRAFVTGSACGVCSADLLDLALLASAAPHSLRLDGDRRDAAEPARHHASAAARVRSDGRAARGRARRLAAGDACWWCARTSAGTTRSTR